eukprot:GHVS01108318.1.p1 GENE.GHVS01108318.1~~GHVS01108318.1.p1  ORF type:complete len:707 (+),score=128.71 GHVS01108318.1:122-2242(+)
MPYHTQHNNNQHNNDDIQMSDPYVLQDGRPLPRFVLVQVLPTVQVFHMVHQSPHRLVPKTQAISKQVGMKQQTADENQQHNKPRQIQEFIVRSATSRLNMRSQLSIVLYNNNVYVSRTALGDITTRTTYSTTSQQQQLSPLPPYAPIDVQNNNTTTNGGSPYTTTILTDDVYIQPTTTTLLPVATPTPPQHPYSMASTTTTTSSSSSHFRRSSSTSPHDNNNSNNSNHSNDSNNNTTNPCYVRVPTAVSSSIATTLEQQQQQQHHIQTQPQVRRYRPSTTTRQQQPPQAANNNNNDKRAAVWKHPERLAQQALQLGGGICAEYNQRRDGSASEFFESTFYAKMTNNSGEYVEIPLCKEEITNEHVMGNDIETLLRQYLKVEHNTIIKVGPSPWTMTVNPNYATKLQPADYPVFVLKKVDVVTSSPTELMLHRDYNVFYDVLLGKGGNGEVFLGINRQTGHVCAFKREAPNMLYSEYHYLIRAQHIHQVTAVAYYPAQDLHDYLVLEFLSGGTIRHLLKTKYNNGLPFDFVRRYFYQVTLAIARMHSVGLVHRDLKTANLMLSQPYPYGRIKIVDFGNGHQMTRRDSRICNNLTTCFACAPEIFGWVYDKRDGYTEKVDMWAAGTILYELFTGHRLFEGSTLEEVWPLVKTFDPQSLQLPMETRDVPAEAIDLLKRLLNKEPEQRLSATETLRHAYMSGLADTILSC